jgi:hypothetical protein
MMVAISAVSAFIALTQVLLLIKAATEIFTFLSTLKHDLSKSTCPEAFVDELAGRSTIGD